VCCTTWRKCAPSLREQERFPAEDRARIDLDITQARLPKAHPLVSASRAFFGVGHWVLPLHENTSSAAARQTTASTLVAGPRAAGALAAGSRQKRHFESKAGQGKRLSAMSQLIDFMETGPSGRA
jgi:hypothetical protein